VADGLFIVALIRICFFVEWLIEFQQ